MEQNIQEMTEILSRQVHELMMAYRTGFATPTQMPGSKKLTAIENELIGLLEWRSSVAIKEVVAFLKVPNSTVTSAVNRLEHKGLLSRESLPEDKRAFVLKLTQSGKDMISFRRFKKHEFFKDILEALDSPEERQALIDTLGKMTASLSIVDDSQRRRGHMNALEKEYYDFGPWLIEVKRPEDIPQQYMQFRKLVGDARYCFKVPIKKEWRHIHPGMLLYKMLVVIQDEGLTLLEAKDGDVIKTELTRSEIRYLVHGTDLLDSHIIIGTDLKVYDIDYNSVSQEISTRVINTMRRYLFKDAKGIDLNKVNDLPSVESQLYNELINRGLNDEKVKVVAFQPFVRLEKHNPSTAEVLLMTHNKYELQDVVILTNGKELILVSRNKLVKRSKDTDYSFRHTFFRMEHIKDFVLTEDKEMEHLKTLSIYSGDARVSLKVSDTFDIEPLTALL